MKIFIKTVGIFTFLILIGLSFAACKDEGDPSLSGKVTIDGLLYAGQALTANTSALGGSGTISYQWRLDGNNIDRANEKTYIVQFSDVGSSITVKVTRSGYTGGIVSEPAVTELPPLPGIVSIDGPAHAGKPIKANTSALGGQGNISYQWRLNGVDISGANKESFLIRLLDAGSTFTVKVTRAGNIGEKVSEPSDIVLSALSGIVSIDGIAHSGETLIANTDALDGNGTITYQWKLNGKNISGENGKTYTVQSSDENLAITVEVTRSGYWGEKISEPASKFPRLTGVVIIDGEAFSGQTLTANTDDLDGEGEIGYQWRRNGININGAIEDGYLIQSSDEGLTITVKVTRAGYVGEIISQPTAAVLRPIIPVTDIANVTTLTKTASPLTLSGTVTPSNATNKALVWTLLNPGTTEASIYGTILNTKKAGTALVRATITNGLNYGIDYTQDFLITVEDPVGFTQWVTRVDFGSSSTVTIDLKNLKNHDIYLTKINTGAAAATAANTGSAANVIPDYSGMPVEMPRFYTMPGSELPKRGRPLNDVVKLPPLVPDDPSIIRPLANKMPYIVGDTKNFFVETSYNSGTFSSKPAALLATGTHGNVWVMDNSITTTQAQAMAEKFDIIYPVTTNIFGYEYGGKPGHSAPGGRDGDLKVQILVYNIGNNIAGFFWGKDHYTTSQYAGSNQAEIFYIDAGVTKSNPLYIYDTLTHEFQHMIHWNVKRIENGRDSSTWYNEMMSMISQDIISSIIGLTTASSDHVINSSIPYFLTYYANEGFTTWSSEWISYTTKYAFGAYLVRNYGGAEFVRKLSANKTIDQTSIEEALNEMVPGTTYNEALIRFGEAMVYNSSKIPEGVHTFDKTVKTTVNGTEYTAVGFNIWNTTRYGSSTKGPVVYDLTQREIKPRSVTLHTSNAWQNKSGDYSITLQKPNSNNVVFVLIAKER